MSRTKRFLINTAMIGGFLILPLLLYWNVTLGGRTMLPVDNLYQWQPWKSYAAEFGVTVPDNALLSDLILENYVWKKHIRETVLNGEIPLWNPYLFAGAPFLATGQNAGFYPFTVLFLIMPLAKAYGWYTLSQLWLAGALAYIYARVLGQRRLSAAVAGVVYQGCGFMLVSAAVFPMIIGAAAWLPLILAGLEMVIRNTTSRRGAGKTLPWATLGAFALGVQILAGHVEITYYSLIVMAFYAAWRLVTRVTGRAWRRSYGLLGVPAWSGRTLRRLVRPVAWLGATVLVGLMLGAIQLIPFYEVGSSNFRAGAATLAEVRGWGFPTRRALTFALPDFFGNPADHTVTDVFSAETIALAQNYWGNLNPHGPHTTSWGIKNYVEGGVYLGILPLVLAGLAVVSVLKRPHGDAKPPRFGSRRSAVGFFATLSLVCLAFIFGTPLYALLYYGFPGLNQLHSPFRWVFPLSLCAAVLAGFGMEYVAQTRFDWEQKRRRLYHTVPGWTRPLRLWGYPAVVTWTAGALFGGGALVLAGLAGSWLFYGRLEPLFERVFLGLALAPDAFPDVRTFYSYQFWNALHLGVALLASGLVLRLSRADVYLPDALQRLVRPHDPYARLPIWPLLALGLILLDLLVVGYSFNAAVDPALLDFKPELVRWLEQQPDRNLWRLTTFDNKGTKPFNANAAWLTGFQDVRGYDSIIAKQYVDYVRAIEPQNELQFNRVQPIGNWQALNSPLLDLLGVKYVITEETLDLPKLTQVWAGEGLRVYENLAAVPRAYTLPQSATMLVEDGAVYRTMNALDPRRFVIVEQGDWNAAERQPLPGRDALDQAATAAAYSPATVTRYTGREVSVDVTAGEPVWLILNDSHFPGWNAFVRPQGSDDDREVQHRIVRVNGNFRGVQLQPGAWSVRFRYSPLTFLLGGLTNIMAAVILLFCGAVWAWRRFYRPQGKLTNTRSIAKNSVAPMALNLFNRSIDFVFAAFYLRLLGPADAGGYATAIAIAGLYEIIANFGLNAYLIREVSQARERAASYLLNTTILRLGTGLFGSLPIFLYLWRTDFGAETVTAVLFLMVGMILSGMGLGMTGLFYAFEEAEIPAAITTITTILKVGFGVIVLLTGFGFVGLAAVSILVNLITLAILALAAFRRYTLDGPWSIDFSLQRRMLVSSYPLMLNHLLATIYWQVDVLLLREINGEEVVGWYNSAYKYVNAFNIIPSFFTFALFPVIARQVQSDVSAARRTFRISAKLLILVALPLAAVVTLLAPLMIEILGGDAFLPHGYIALQIVIWSIPFGWLNSVTNYVLISLGQERMQTRAFIIGVGFNIGGNLLLLPALSYVGAGLTTIASEIVLLAIFNYYLVQKLESVRWVALLWRPVAVTAVMVAAMLAVAQLNIWLGLLVGLALYPAGLWLARTFGEEEQRILSSLLPQKIAARLRLAEAG